MAHAHASVLVSVASVTKSCLYLSEIVLLCAILNLTPTILSEINSINPRFSGPDNVDKSQNQEIS